MPLPAISPDHSHYQPRLDSTFIRDWDIFKCTQGTGYIDDAFDANAAAAASLYGAGRLAGADAYHVITTEDPLAQFHAIVATISRGGPPPDWLGGVMIDLESWPGTPYALHGDISSIVNRLGGYLAAWLKSWRAVRLYANSYDLSLLAPHRDLRMPFHLAAYTSDLRFRAIKGAIAQQYSDGESRWSVPKIGGVFLPRSSAPFGNCDHNVFPAFATGRALRDWIRPLEEDVTPDEVAAQVTEMIDNALIAVLKGDPRHHWNHAEHGDIVPPSPDQGVFDRLARLERRADNAHESLNAIRDSLAQIQATLAKGTSHA